MTRPNHESTGSDCKREPDRDLSVSAQSPAMCVYPAIDPRHTTRLLMGSGASAGLLLRGVALRRSGSQHRKRCSGAATARAQLRKGSLREAAA